MSKANVGYHGTRRKHTKEDALSDREYELLLESASQMDEYYRLQCKLVLLLGGRLGMRAGEIAHLKESWIDWRRNMIVIPRYQRCEKGKGGGVCGYCRSQAEQMLEHNEGMEYEDAEHEMWSPKTEAAAREIPFDASTRAEICMERFFDVYDGWPRSRQVVNRRVNRVAESTNEVEVEEVYPHCLRATAATRFAARGLDIFALKSMMGWADLQTAKCYISSSGERTAQAIRDITL